jgi:hypothetical protein
MARCGRAILGGHLVSMAAKSVAIVLYLGSPSSEASMSLSHTLYCPYCNEPIEIVIDPSLPSQSYIEDCQVCCRPINLEVEIDEDGHATVHAATEDEA